jgi:hypothetical protein
MRMRKNSLKMKNRKRKCPQKGRKKVRHPPTYCAQSVVLDSG